MAEYQKAIPYPGEKGKEKLESRENPPNKPVIEQKRALISLSAASVVIPVKLLVSLPARFFVSATA